MTIALISIVGAVVVVVVVVVVRSLSHPRRGGASRREAGLQPGLCGVSWVLGASWASDSDLAFRAGGFSPKPLGFRVLGFEGSRILGWKAT